VIVELLKDNPELPIIALSVGRLAVTADFNLDSSEMLGLEVFCRNLLHMSYCKK
jgi:hypothetical protein